MCVDLERRRKSGQAKTLEHYRDQSPKLLAREPVLQRLAFEEYPLASSRNAMVSSVEYGRRYQIQTDHWPRPRLHANHADSLARGALAEGVVDEMARITAVTQT